MGKYKAFDRDVVSIDLKRSAPDLQVSVRVAETDPMGGSAIRSLAR